MSLENQKDHQVPPALYTLHRRIESQERILVQIRDMIVTHIAEEKKQTKLEEPVAKALDELVLIWRASKILIPLLVGVSVALWGFINWWKDHVK